MVKGKEKCITAFNELKVDSFKVNSVSERKTNTSPPKTFITSTLQQEANNKWRMSPKITMSVAQSLYVRGVITYPRVDSHNVAEEKQNEIRELISEKYGEEYLGPDSLEQVEVKNSQDAHEAIRPTDFSVEQLDDSFSDQEKRMYEMIYKRTVAAFMSDCVTLKKKYVIKNGNYKFEVNEDIIDFYGWKILYKKEEKPEINLTKNETVEYNEIIGKEKPVTCPKSHYTEASLIKHLDELGVGRPSTYATMISIVLDRKYATIKDIPGKKVVCNNIQLKNNSVKEFSKEETVGSEKKKIIPTDIGEVVNEFMEKYFSNLLDVDYTNQLELELDKIAENKLKSEIVLKKVNSEISDTISQIQEKDSKFKDNYRRDLGFYPKTQNMISCYIGKYGPVLCLDSNGKKKFVSITDEKILKTITLEEAVELLKFPKVLGKVKGKEVKLCKGKYGPYINYNKKNVKFPRDLDINKVKLKQIQEHSAFTNLF